jgi:hypothetical protein
MDDEKLEKLAGGSEKFGDDGFEDPSNLAPHITVGRMRPKSSTQPRGGQALASVEAETDHTGNAYGNVSKEKTELMM